MGFAVGKGNHDPLRIVDNMTVGKNKAIGGEDESRSGGMDRPALLVPCPRFSRRELYSDIHDSGANPFGSSYNGR